MISFKVPKMRCGGCVEQITACIQQLDAQAHVACDLASKTVHIESQQSPEHLQQALTAAGYPPEQQ